MSPIISVSSGATARRSIRCSNMSGFGFGKPSSAQRVAWKRRARPLRASTRESPIRDLPVAIASR